jgi:hypothetical protein
MQRLSSAAITQRRPARQAQPTLRTLHTTAPHASGGRVRASARVFAHADANRLLQSAHHFAPGCPPGAPPRQPRRSAHSACTTQPCLGAIPVPCCCPKRRMHPKPANQAPQLVTSALYVLPPQRSKVLAPAPRRRVVGRAAHEADENKSLQCRQRSACPKRRRAARTDVIPHVMRSLRAARTFRACCCAAGRLRVLGQTQAC